MTPGLWAAGGSLVNKLAIPGQAAAPTTLSSWVSMMPGAQALADSMEQEEEAMPGGLNLVVMGPPLAGKSTQAQMLADRYQLVTITIDELLMVTPPVITQCPACCSIEPDTGTGVNALRTCLYMGFSKGLSVSHRVHC